MRNLPGAPALTSALSCLALTLWPHLGALAAPAAPARVADPLPSLHGRVVTFARNGYEPDGDPVDRVIIEALLRQQGGPAARGPLSAQDRRVARPRFAGQGGFPDMTLVLSTYLENFQTATVPILPDLLRKDVTATSLGGFMQGKAALVDGAGRVRYRGSVLAEVFLDNSIHIVADLDPQGLPAAAASLRLSGAVTLRKDLTLAGSLRASRAPLPAEALALRAGRPRAVSWRAVVAGLRVRYPRMMGTSGAGVVPGAPPPSTQSTTPATVATGGQAQGPAPAPVGSAVSRPAAAGAQRQQPRAQEPNRLSLVWLGALGAVALALLGAVLSVRARATRRRPA